MNFFKRLFNVVQSLYNIRLYSFKMFCILMMYSKYTTYNFDMQDEEDGAAGFDPAYVHVWGNNKTILVNTILHELGHIIDDVVHKNNSGKLKSEYSAWRNAFAIAKEWNIKLDIEDARQCMLAYHINNRKINKLFQEMNYGT